jgi:hypothetical protein
MSLILTATGQKRPTLSPSLQLRRGSGEEEKAVMNALNQAFDPSLEASECVEPAKKIMAILPKRNEPR